jgi:hypothetical protein
MGDLHRVVRVRDVDDPEAVVVAVVGRVASERDVRVDVPHPIRFTEECGRVGAVALRVHVLGVATRVVVGGRRHHPTTSVSTATISVADPMGRRTWPSFRVAPCRLPGRGAVVLLTAPPPERRPDSRAPDPHRWQEPAASAAEDPLLRLGVHLLTPLHVARSVPRVRPARLGAVGRVPTAPSSGPTAAP